MTLAEAAASVGRSVLYMSAPDVLPEAGEITSVNDAYVFVRYGYDVHSKATRAEDLVLE